MSDFKKILIVKIDEIGDAVLATPFLRELRNNTPDAWITLVVKPAVYNLAELCPYVNEVLTYDWNTKGMFRLIKKHIRALLFAKRHFWEKRVDLAILPRWDADYYHGTFLAYFSGAPRRIGYSEKVNPKKKAENKNYDLLLTDRLNTIGIKHEVERNLDVIRYLGGKVENDNVELWLSEEDHVFAQGIFNKYNLIPDNHLICIAPGAGQVKKIWTLYGFIELCKWLEEKHNGVLIIIGGRTEEKKGRTIKEKVGNGVIDLCGKCTLRQTVSILKRCKLVIGNDTGVMHIAAAMNIPVIGIFCHPKTGSPLSENSPERFAPWGKHHVVIQPDKPVSPCVDECIADYPHCILSITVEQVKRVVAEQISQAKEVR